MELNDLVWQRFYKEIKDRELQADQGAAGEWIGLPYKEKTIEVVSHELQGYVIPQISTRGFNGNAVIDNEYVMEESD